MTAGQYQPLTHEITIVIYIFDTQDEYNPLVQYAECRCSECRYTECHHAECHHAEYHHAECYNAECRFDDYIDTIRPY